MKRILAATLLLSSLGSFGCAEFDGFYDDEPNSSMKRGAWDDRRASTDRPVDEAPKATGGAYSGSDVRR